MIRKEIKTTVDKQKLNQGAEMPTFDVMRGRIVIGLSLGILGICLGVAGAVFSINALGIVAAICAVSGCFAIAGVSLIPLLRRAHLHSNPQQAAATPESSETESVVDPVSGFPDGRYFEIAVEGRVAAARRHLWPVSIVLLQLGFDPTITSESRDTSIAHFSGLMRQTLREADVACRIDETTFGLILEDTSEEGGVWTAERLQIALSHDLTSIRRLVAGVAAYPTHGLFSKDVLVRAYGALQKASSTPPGHGLGQVEVAHVDI